MWGFVILLYTAVWLLSVPCKACQSLASGRCYGEDGRHAGLQCMHQVVDLLQLGIQDEDQEELCLCLFTRL